MLCSGVQPFTLLDFPGKVACVVFVAGCPFRCGYCHNPEFVLPDQIQKLADRFISHDALLAFLQSRVGKLEGVVVSGGEPTTAPDLIHFFKTVRELGFSTKLDTNGYFPERLCELIGERVLDYIAMDIKGDADTYAQVAGIPMDMERIRHSIAAIMQSGVEYEFRSTLVKEIHTPAVLERMEHMIHGATRWYWQRFRPGHVLDPAWSSRETYTLDELENLTAGLSGSVPVTIRS